jgi:hypothetical protein
MELERMSRITRMSHLATAKEFIDMVSEKASDSLTKLQQLENDIHTIKEATDEAILQLNNAIYEDCM